MKKRSYHPVVDDAILDIRKDTEAFKLLEELAELMSVSIQNGGFYFSDWERGFVANLREQEPIFSQAQRDKIKEIWQAADLRKRAGPDEKAQNLFSALSPERQAEQRARAAKVKFPWEK